MKFRLSREDFRCKKDLISISLSSNDLNHLDEDIFADLLQITSIQLSIKDFNSSKRLIRLLRINLLRHGLPYTLIHASTREAYILFLELIYSGNLVILCNKRHIPDSGATRFNI